MKYADNIAKCFATAIAIVSGTVFSVPLFHFTLTPIFGVGAICTILASVLYSMAPEGLFPSCSRANAAVAAVILVVPGVAGAASQTSHAGQVVVPVTSMSGAGRVAQISRVDILPRAQTPTTNVTGPLCGTDMTGGCEQMSQICHTCSTRMLGRRCDSTALLTEQELPSVPRIYSFECITASSAKPPLVNFFSCAQGYEYERFLPLYAFFALHYNQRAVAELVVPNRTTFLKLHSTPLSLLQDLYGHKAVCVREYRRSLPPRVVANTRRYLEVPALAAKYTYIGDIDVLITEPVVSPERLQQMLHFDLPYSNVVRPTPPKGLKRLTGVMLMKTAQFYTPALRKAQLEVNPEGNDENFLARLVEASHLGLPPLPSLNRSTNQWTTYRPVHGLHLSLSRGCKGSARGRAMGISVRPGAWCKVLRTPVLHRYLCTDSAGRTILRSFAEFAFCSSENGAASPTKLPGEAGV